MICRSDKTFMLKNLHNYVINWYHTHLLNTEINFLGSTISQHYYWTKLIDKIHNQTKVSKNFQKKKQKNKYVYLSAEEMEFITW